MKNCPNCQTSVEDNVTFCPSCGTKMADESTLVKDQDSSTTEKTVSNKKKWFVPAIIAAVALVLLVIIATVIFSGGSKAPKGAVYVADGNLMYTTYGKKATEITEDPARSSVYVSKNLKYLYYSKSTDNGTTWYVKKYGNLKKDATKIATNIYSSIYITDDGKTLFYIKDDNLYSFNVKKGESTKLKGDVNNFVSSPNGKIIYYQTQNDDGDNVIYLYGKKESKKIATGADLVSVSEDFKTVYFTIDDNLFKSKNGKEKVKILSDVSQIYMVYEDGKIYYAKNDGEDTKLCFFDGKKEHDICKDDFSCYTVSYDKPILVYSVIGEDEIVYMCAWEENTSKITTNDDGAKDFTISSDSKTLYYIDKVDDGAGELFSAKLSKKLGKAKSVAKDVAEIYTVYDYTKEDSDSIILWENSEGEVYLDGKRVDYTVSGFVSWDSDGKKLYYYDGDGALKMFKGKKSVTISEEAKYTCFTADGHFLYIDDVSSTSGKGTLKLWTGKKSKTIADDVASIGSLNVSSYIYNYNYSW